jgi:hypothetical protein
VPYPIAYEGIDLPDVLQDFGGNQGSLSRGSMRPMSLFMTFGMFGTKGAAHLSGFQYDSQGSSQFD